MVSVDPEEVVDALSEEVVELESENSSTFFALRLAFRCLYRSVTSSSVEPHRSNSSCFVNWGVAGAADFRAACFTKGGCCVFFLNLGRF